MVDTVKRAIAKDPSNWRKQLFDFLYSYHYTCSESSLGKSPAKHLFGRRMNPPFTKWLPKLKAPRYITVDSTEKQQAMEKQFLKHHGARPRLLAIGDRVVVLTWKDKQEQDVIHKILSKVRYSVKLDDGRIIDRHINHIWGTIPIVPSKSLEDDVPGTKHPAVFTQPKFHHKNLLPLPWIPRTNQQPRPQLFETRSLSLFNRLRPDLVETRLLRKDWCWIHPPKATRSGNLLEEGDILYRRATPAEQLNTRECARRGPRRLASNS